MNLDASNNRLAEIRKQLKEKRKQKNSVKLEHAPICEVPNSQSIENIATIIPSFSSSSSTPVFQKQAQLPLPERTVFQKSTITLEQKKQDVLEPTSNRHPVATIREQEVKKQGIPLPSQQNHPVVAIQEPEVKIPPPPRQVSSNIKKTF